MNYFEFYVGDYARDTRHCSLAEHGAFLMLLSAYYATEKPLPADYVALYRICSAMAPEEQAAVRSVADAFFPVAADGLRHNARADIEIPKALARIEKARTNGKRGGRPPKEPSGNPAGFDPVNRNGTQPLTEPLTGIEPAGKAPHTPYTKQEQEQKKEQGARATRLPQDWQPSPDELAWARNARPDVDPAAEAAKFRDYWHAKGGKDAAKADWSATWRNWIRNAHAPPRRATPPTSQSKQVQALAAILGVNHESNDPSRLVLDLDPVGPGADLRALPHGFPVV